MNYYFYGSHSYLYVAGGEKNSYLRNSCTVFGVVLSYKDAVLEKGKKRERHLQLQ